MYYSINEAVTTPSVLSFPIRTGVTDTYYWKSNVPYPAGTVIYFYSNKEGTTTYVHVSEEGY